MAWQKPLDQAYMQRRSGDIDAAREQVYHAAYAVISQSSQSTEKECSIDDADQRNPGTGYSSVFEDLITSGRLRPLSQFESIFHA